MAYTLMTASGNWRLPGASWLVAAWRRIRRFIQYRKDYGQLSRMCDHSLRDIGITRDQLRELRAENVLQLLLR